MSNLIEKAEKSEVIENMLEEVSKLMAAPRSTAFTAQSCVMCGNEATEFRDELSKKEYSLSGMCQVCQDKFFGE